MICSLLFHFNKFHLIFFSLKGSILKWKKKMCVTQNSFIIIYYLHIFLTAKWLNDYLHDYHTVRWWQNTKGHFKSFYVFVLLWKKKKNLQINVFHFNRTKMPLVMVYLHAESINCLSTYMYIVNCIYYLDRIVYKKDHHCGAS